MRIKKNKLENVSFARRKCAWAAAVVVPLLLAGCGEEKVAEVLVRPAKVMVVPEPVTERILTYSGVIAPRMEHTRFPGVGQDCGALCQCWASCSGRAEDR